MRTLRGSSLFTPLDLWSYGVKCQPYGAGLFFLARWICGPTGCMPVLRDRSFLFTLTSYPVKETR